MKEDKNMNMIEYELAIIKRTRKDMFKAVDRDGINHLYKQARIWNRFHYFLAGACTYQRYCYLNNKFKKARLEALNAIR